MLFASFDFLLFFALVFLGWRWLPARRTQRLVLIIFSSYFFYMAAPKPASGALPTPWYFAGLLAFSTVLDYFAALGIEHSRAARSVAEPERAHPGERGFMALSLCANLGLLGYFKYTGFLFEVANDLSALVGAPLALPTIRLLLPVGISFYTFQSLSYTLDVYRGHLKAEREFLRFAAFIAFFPQLVAGPIVRAKELLPQLRAQPELTRQDVDFAVYRVSRGLIKKVLFADFIAGSFTDRVFAAPSEFSSLENLVALYAFTLQIYADFSGYSDIAIGTARLFGFRFPENFQRPYRAVDVADFWRRWHMTLSTWLRDYVYYPLGGSRLGPVRTLVNLWLTMFLVGIWHGATWNFVIYALLQASAMVFSRVMTGRAPGLAGHGQLLVGALVMGVLGFLLDAGALHSGSPGGVFAAVFLLSLFIGALPKASERSWLTPLHIFLTVHFSVLARVFFRAESLGDARAMIGQLIHVDGRLVREGLFAHEPLVHWLAQHPSLKSAAPLGEFCLLLVLLLGFALHYVPERWTSDLPRRLITRLPAVLVGVAFATLLGLLSLLLAAPRANIYFAF